MFRKPFDWDVMLRREVLDAELMRLREVPYSMWRDVVGRSLTKMVTGRDERAYRVSVTAGPASEGSDDIRVTLALDAGVAFRRRRMNVAFIITPQNTFKQ